jgi:hypothetical protein
VKNRARLEELAVPLTRQGETRGEDGLRSQVRVPSRFCSFHLAGFDLDDKCESLYVQKSQQFIRESESLDQFVFSELLAEISVL